MPRKKTNPQPAATPQEVAEVVVQEVILELSRKGSPLPLNTMMAVVSAVQKKVSETYPHIPQGA